MSLARAQVCGGENRPFAVMMVLTSVYMVTELAVSLVTGCVSLARRYNTFDRMGLIYMCHVPKNVDTIVTKDTSPPNQPTQQPNQTNQPRSIALEADSFHMLSDALALGTAWWAQVRNRARAWSLGTSHPISCVVVCPSKCIICPMYASYYI